MAAWSLTCRAVTVGGTEIDRGTYELTVFGATAIMFVIAVIFGAVGRKHAIHDEWPDEGITADRREVAAARRA